MNTEHFIARRLSSSKKKGFSKFIIRLAVTATALSIAVMIISSAIILGFQQQISEKVFGFWGHIQIMNFDFNYGQSYENDPVNIKQNFYPHIDTFPEIDHIQIYATKPAIAKVNDQIEGIVLKGIGADFDWQFFEKSLVEGTSFLIDNNKLSNNVLISKATAKRLKLSTGDDFLVYFIQEPPRARKFKITGIYNTGIEEYDQVFAIIDIKHIQKLNNWSPNQAGGFELFIHDINYLDKASDFVYNHILDLALDAKTIKEINPNIFDWLELQNVNQQLILILMTIVAAINLITVLLILILERTNMVGILKALGASNWFIRKIFLYNAFYIIIVGLGIGNLVGLGLCFIQKYFSIVSLPEESYYLSVVPIDLSISSILYINLAAIILNLLILIIPSYLVVRISPVKAIRFS